MAEVQDTSQVENRESEHSLGAYSEKVGEIIRKENERFTRLAQEQAKDILNDALQKAEEVFQEGQKKAAEVIADSQKKAEGIIADSQKNAANVSREIEERAHQKSSEMIEDAKQRTQQIVEEAEEKAKKEAKSRVKSNEEKILAKAREEADSLLITARENAEKESKEIMERVRVEAERGLEEEVAKFRAEAQKQTDQISKDAQKRASKLIDNIIDDTKEVNEIIVESIKTSEKILGKFNDEIQAESGELAKNIMAARRKLEQKITRFAEKSEDETVLQKINAGSNKKPALWVALKGEQLEGRDDGKHLFKGYLELKTLSPIDYIQIKGLKDVLTQVPNIKYLSESSSEDGTMLSFEIKEPLPLIDILNEIPLVENVETQGDNIKLILN